MFQQNIPMDQHLHRRRRRKKHMKTVLAEQRRLLVMAKLFWVISSSRYDDIPAALCKVSLESSQNSRRQSEILGAVFSGSSRQMCLKSAAQEQPQRHSQ